MGYASADEYFYAALGWFDNEQLDKAIQISSEGIRKYPNYPDLYRIRSTFYEASQEYDKAINDAERFIELQPGDASVYHYLGCLLHKAGRLREAEARLTERLRNPLIWFWLILRGEKFVSN